MHHGGIAMNTSNITNYKPKDFAEIIRCLCENITALGQGRNAKSKSNSN